MKAEPQIYDTRMRNHIIGNSLSQVSTLTTHLSPFENESVNKKIKEQIISLEDSFNILNLKKKPNTEIINRKIKDLVKYIDEETLNTQIKKGKFKYVLKELSTLAEMYKGLFGLELKVNVFEGRNNNPNNLVTSLGYILRDDSQTRDFKEFLFGIEWEERMEREEILSAGIIDYTKGKKIDLVGKLKELIENPEYVKLDIKEDAFIPNVIPANFGDLLAQFNYTEKFELAANKEYMEIQITTDKYKEEFAAFLRDRYRDIKNLQLDHKPSEEFSKCQIKISLSSHKNL